MVLCVFSFTEDNQNLCGEITNIYVMWTVDRKRKIYNVDGQNSVQVANLLS